MIGGALGAGARQLVGKWTLHALVPGYPWCILTVNLVGGFVMGLLAGFLMRQSVSHENFRLFVGVGILGGFTTFSSFSLDVATMIERGDWGVALGYVLVSVRSEEHTSELQSLMRNSYSVFCLKKKKK